MMEQALATLLRGQAVFNRVVNELRRRAKLELVKDPRAIGTDRLDAECDLIGDAGDSLSLSKQPQDLHLSVRE